MALDESKILAWAKEQVATDITSHACGWNDALWALLDELKNGRFDLTKMEGVQK